MAYSNSMALAYRTASVQQLEVRKSAHVSRIAAAVIIRRSLCSKRELLRTTTCTSESISSKFAVYA
jgi:hypothetical protein